MPPAKRGKKDEIVSKESHVAATFLIGRSVVKEFKGIGTFKGRVTDFHRDTGFLVEYEDGDTEDLTESALVRYGRLRGRGDPAASGRHRRRRRRPPPLLPCVACLPADVVAPSPRVRSSRFWTTTPTASPDRPSTQAPSQRAQALRP